jgi:hypothetical protein
MNIIMYGLGGAAAFVIFIMIYSYVETHIKERTYRMKLEKRLKNEMDSEEDYRQKLALAIPVTNEIFPAKKKEGIHIGSIKTSIEL